MLTTEVMIPELPEEKNEPGRHVLKRETLQSNQGCSNEGLNGSSVEPFVFYIRFPILADSLSHTTGLEPDFLLHTREYLCKPFRWWRRSWIEASGIP